MIIINVNMLVYVLYNMGRILIASHCAAFKWLM